MSRLHRVTLVLAVLFVLLPHSSLWADDAKNVIRFGVGLFEPVGTDEGDPERAAAAWISYERLLTGMLGLDVMLADADYDPIFGDVFESDIDLIPLTVSANFHLTPESRLDFYVAPTIGAARLQNKFLGETESKTEFAWGAAAGLDVPLGKSAWVFTVQARYLGTSFDSDDGGSKSFNNVIGLVGVGIRF